MTTVSDDLGELRSQLKALDIEFLHGVPVHLPDSAIDQIVQLLAAKLRQVETEARISELEWALSRLNIFRKETDSDALKRATDEIDDNLTDLHATLTPVNKEEG